MRIAVVIPALHEADRVRAAVRSARGPDVDVIVADGGSSDATRERAREEGAQVVVSAPGRARQLAAGLAEAGTADVVLFLHADTELPGDWAAKTHATLARMSPTSVKVTIEACARHGEGTGACI